MSYKGQRPPRQEPSLVTAAFGTRLKEGRFLAALFVGWGVFALWCVNGFPPCVDLPAHGAQLQTLVEMLRGSPTLEAVYEAKFRLGYGLTYWLFAPLAYATNGAFAIRATMWLALMLYPLSQLALARAFKRPDWTLLLGLPLAFNISYWYGLLSGLVAQSLLYFGLAAFVRALERPHPRRLLLMNVIAATVLLEHLLAFVALIVLTAALTAASRPLRPAMRVMALGVALPVLLSLTKVWSMALRAAQPGEWAPTTYDFGMHLSWFFRNYGPEGNLAALAPLIISSVMVMLFLTRPSKEPSGPVVLLAAAVLLYFLTPNTLSGIFLASARLPVIVGMLALLVADASTLPRPVRVAMVSLCFASLAQTALFHHRFKREVAGLDALLSEAPQGRHGYLTVAGRTVLDSKQVYLEHLGQWATARWGGFGHNFFADAEHHPVRFRPGAYVPGGDLLIDSAEHVALFDEVLVFGEAEFPPTFATWQEVQRAGAWRKIRRTPR